MDKHSFDSVLETLAEIVEFTPYEDVLEAWRAVSSRAEEATKLVDRIADMFDMRADQSGVVALGAACAMMGGILDTIERPDARRAATMLAIWWMLFENPPASASLQEEAR